MVGFARWEIEELAPYLLDPNIHNLIENLWLNSKSRNESVLINYYNEYENKD